MRLLAVLFFMLLASCILFVSPEEYGSTCRIQGQDTQCGACVVAKCQADLDTCCRDESCDQALRDLDECAVFATYGCQRLAGWQSPPVTGALSQCVQQKCGAVCLERKGSSTTSCREPRLGEGSACTCTSGAETNDFICNPQAFRDTICCAPESWPAPGLECKCQALDCRSSPDGCFCKLADFTPKTRECTTQQCCAGDDYCQCGSDECSLSERKVDTCTVTELACAKGQKKLETCSGRTL
jgi:hypothetical protein